MLQLIALSVFLIGCSTEGTSNTVPTTAAPSVAAPPPLDEAKVAEVLAKLTADDQAAKAEALKAFPTVTVDEVNQKKFRSPKAAPKYVNSRTSIHAVVSCNMQDEVTAVLVQWGYVANDWLFFKEAIIATGDFRSTVSFNDPTRDNGGGKIWEYANLALVDEKKLEQFMPGFALPKGTAEKMTDPAKVTVRFEGRKSYKDYELKAWEKDSIKAGIVLTKEAPTREDAIATMKASEKATVESVAVTE